MSPHSKKKKEEEEGEKLVGGSGRVVVLTMVTMVFHMTVFHMKSAPARHTYSSSPENSDSVTLRCLREQMA